MDPSVLSCFVSLIWREPVFESVVVEFDSMMKRSILLVKVGRFDWVGLCCIFRRYFNLVTNI